MAFRDESEALRARIEALEVELGDARDEIAALERDAEDVVSLRARVSELEAELAKYTHQPAPPSRTKSPARRYAVVAALIALAIGAVAYFAMQELGGPDPAASPTHGVLSLDSQPLPPPIFDNAWGANEAGSGCAGYVSSEPLVSLETTTPRTVRLWTTSSSDLVLYVRLQGGRVICDDDSGEGMNPMLAVELPPGRHQVWVGTFGSGNRHSFTLHVDGRTNDDAALHVDAAPSGGRVDLEGVDRHERRGRTLGDVPAAQARTGCAGHVPLVPSYTLHVGEPGTARIVARSPTDLVLLVQRPDGSFVCDDDGAGSYDPQVIEALQLGVYRVWVGTYAAQQSAEFDLSIDVDGPERADPNTPPRLGRWDLDDESLLSFSERVDGQTPVSRTQAGCRTRYARETPDLELTLTEALSVTLSLTSASRLGVLVEHPDGTQTCDPDVQTQAYAWSPGVHRLWVAAPQPGADAPFTLVVQTQAE